jgi:hypothetical protein
MIEIDSTQFYETMDAKFTKFGHLERGASRLGGIGSCG